jgi:phage repressor protein C with HTH and peptisase S24 domain
MSQNTTTVLNNVNTKVVCFFNTDVLDSQTMKLTYGDRLRAARIHKGLSQNRLAEISGVGQGTISKIERGDQDCSAADIKLAKALEIDPIWLSEGDEHYAPAWLIGGTSQSQPEGINKCMEVMVDNSSNKIRHAPIVGKAQLGDNGYWCDMEYPNGYGDGYIKFPTDDEEVYALRCVGDSMRPRVKNGEFVIIEPNTPCQPGDEVLVKSKDGRVMVKIFLYEREGYFSFQSVNENHPSFSLPTEEIAAMHHVAAIVKSSRWIKY